MHRKALVAQKRYLQCQVDAFFQSQQSALLIMADMGAPVDLNLRPPHSKYSRPYARFRAIGCVVIATLRFRYVVRRKMHHIKSHINKLQRRAPMPSSKRAAEPLSLSTVITNESHSYTAPDMVEGNLRRPSPAISQSVGIKSELSGHPIASSLRSVPGRVTFPSRQSRPIISTSLKHQQSSNKIDTQNSLHRFNQLDGDTSITSTSHPRVSVKPLQLCQEALPPLHEPAKSRSPVYQSSSQNVRVSSTTSSPKKHKSPSPAKVPSDSFHDPQLNAYKKGLERLKARLSKTSM